MDIALKNTRQFLVSGRVQGVGFRDATRTRANELGLAGWVRNLSDGRVEVQAAGSGEKLDALADWLDRMLEGQVARASAERAMALDLAVAPGGLTPDLVHALEEAGPYGVGRRGRVALSGEL